MKIILIKAKRLRSKGSRVSLPEKKKKVPESTIVDESLITSCWIPAMHLVVGNLQQDLLLCNTFKQIHS